MPVTVDDIKWGSYQEFSGPYFLGKHAFTLSAAPTQEEAIVHVMAATEGGTFDAYNGYDKCICTSGLVQWCDRAPWFLVCNLFGQLAAHDTSAYLGPVVEFASSHGYTFGRTAEGSWRFWDTQGVVVDTADKQRKLYLGGSTGYRQGWSDAQEEHAKRWAAAVVNVWQDPATHAVQVAYTVKRLWGFAMSSARPLLDHATEVGTNVSKAFQAAYLSFAANNPERAAAALSDAVFESGALWTNEWLVNVLRHLTFDSGIAIYPHRYERIRPELERLYGVELPDFSVELHAWKNKHRFPGMLSTTNLQRALIALGYYLGPRGADGKFGKITRGALRKFEMDVHVAPAYADGYPDQYTIGHLESALRRSGLDLLWT